MTYREMLEGMAGALGKELLPSCPPLELLRRSGGAVAGGGHPRRAEHREAHHGGG